MRLVLALLFFANILGAQDTILLISGEEIAAKVVEVGQEIRYKKANFLDGPIYVLERNEIRSIHYSNGSEEVITAKDARDNSFRIREQYLRATASNRYYEGRRLIDKAEFEERLATQDGLLEVFQNGRSTRNLGYGLVIGGGVAAVIALATVDVSPDPRTSRNVNEPNYAVFGVATGFLVGGAIIAVIGQGKMNNTIQQYNITVGKGIGMKPTLSTNGIGLALRF